MGRNGQNSQEKPTVPEKSQISEEKIDLEDLVVVDQRGHPYNRRTGKVIGRRGEYAPGDPWLMVLVDLDRRCFLFPRSMLRLQKKDEN